MEDLSADSVYWVPVAAPCAALPARPTTSEPFEEMRLKPFLFSPLFASSVPVPTFKFWSASPIKSRLVPACVTGARA